jgi:hypothetical protein
MGIGIRELIQFLLTHIYIPPFPQKWLRADRQQELAALSATPDRAEIRKFNTSLTSTTQAFRGGRGMKLTKPLQTPRSRNAPN